MSDPDLETSRFCTGWPFLMDVDPGPLGEFIGMGALVGTARPELYCWLHAALEGAIRGYGSLTRQQGAVQVRGIVLDLPVVFTTSKGTAEEFRSRFEKDYRRALDRLLLKVSIREISKRQAVRLMFPLLADAPSRRLNAVFDAVMALADPASVLDTALCEYDRTGRERFLSLAASLLEQSGKAAWPTLRQLARSNRPECEFFVDTIAYCEGVPHEERVRALKDLLAHPNHEVQARISDILNDLNAAKKSSVSLVGTD